MKSVSSNVKTVRRPIFKKGEVVGSYLHQYATPLRHRGYQLINGVLTPILVTSPITNA